MLRNFRTPELSRRGIELWTIWFQDGATVHTARASMEVVRECFRSALFHCAELPWPASSPDLSASHYFLWWYLKAKVYPTKSRTTDYLKIAIRKQIS
jgi:hypothetical protein